MAAILSLFLVACGVSLPFGLGRDDSTPRLVRDAELQSPLVRRGLGSAVELTKEAAEVRRLRSQHRGLIESIAPSPTPPPTLTLVEQQKAAGIVVMENPDGVPLEPSVGVDWFDPTVGLDFYRSEGGDWTPRKVRLGHSHRRLFYFEGYPTGVPNFHDGSLLPLIARRLAFEAVDVLPLLGDVTPGLITALAYNMGWELRDGAKPLVNIWSEFEFQSGTQVHRYVAGGVLEFSVGETVDEGVRLEYLVPGEWLGPVVVERLPYP